MENKNVCPEHLTKIDDSKFSMRWQCMSCGDTPDTACYVSLDFYETNGTPMCECADDMEYVGLYEQKL